MATEGPVPLLTRRIVIVTGKGGTGKTTVSAALALAAAERGRRVLVAEVGPFEHIPTLLRDPSAEATPIPEVGYGGKALRPGLHVMRLDPFAALAEYLALQIGSPRLVDLALGNRALRQFLAGAPGWRELITLGKIWFLEQQRTADGGPLYELIVVDAPATGHGITFLDVPHVVQSAVRAGPLARNAARVTELMRDPDSTLVLPVCLAEELPTQETVELIARVRDDLGMTIDRVVVNAVSEPPDVSDPSDLQSALSAIDGRLPFQVLPQPPGLAHAARHLTSRHALNLRYLGEIETRTGLPSCRLPLIARGIDGPEALRRLAGPLLDDPRTSRRPTADGDRATS